jgi:hypothetical protein
VTRKLSVSLCVFRAPLHWCVRRQPARPLMVIAPRTPGDDPAVIPTSAVRCPRLCHPGGRRASRFAHRREPAFHSTSRSTCPFIRPRRACQTTAPTDRPAGPVVGQRAGRHPRFDSRGFGFVGLMAACPTAARLDGWFRSMVLHGDMVYVDGLDLRCARHAHCRPVWHARLCLAPPSPVTRPRVVYPGVVAAEQRFVPGCLIGYRKLLDPTSTMLRCRILPRVPRHQAAMTPTAGPRVREGSGW